MQEGVREAGLRGRGKVLLIGATGNVGSELVRLLAGSDARSARRVRALCRSEEKAETVRAWGAEPVLGDLADPAGLEAAMEDCDRVFLLTPPTPDMVGRERAAIVAARRARVRHVVRVSAADTNPGAPVPWARWHSEIDAYLRASGLEWTVLKPTAFMQNFLSWAPMIRWGRLLGAAGKGRASWIDARDVAAVSARVLLDVADDQAYGHGSATYFLTGPEAFTMDEAAARLSRVLGRTVRYVNVPRIAVRLGMRRAGLPGWFAGGIARQFADVMAGGHSVDVTEEVARLSGRPPRSFDEFARDHRAEFSGTGTGR